MSTIAFLQSAIVDHKAAVASEAEIKRQAAELQSRIAAAEARITEIRANDSGDVTQLAGELSQQQAVIDLSTDRKKRIEAQQSTASAAVRQKYAEIEMTVKRALFVLTGYRRQQRINDLQEYFARWISPSSVSGQAKRWLKETIYNLSAHDASLDETSQLVGRDAGFNRDHVPADPIKRAEHLIAHAAELEAAETWHAADEKEKTASRGAHPLGAFDPVESIELYFHVR